MSKLILSLTVICGAALAQDAVSPGAYVLGPQDRISIRALEAEEISGNTYTIDETGGISLPLIGSLQAAGLTAAELEKQVVARLREFIKQPHVSVSVAEFGSQPVTVLGAVNTPGSQQLRGRRTLREVIAAAGGLRADASPEIQITRRLSSGQLGVPGEIVDASGKSVTGRVNIKPDSPDANIAADFEIRPFDQIVVSAAKVVYVVGEISKSGSYNFTENNSLTALQLVSLAGGFSLNAAPDRAKIMRPLKSGIEREELPLNLKAIIAGKQEDRALQPGDIVVVPPSRAKPIKARAIDTASQLGLWMLTWGLLR